ncbi:MAG: hypothetical protein QW290_09315 [Sulfolobales archaeon]
MKPKLTRILSVNCLIWGYRRLEHCRLCEYFIGVENGVLSCGFQGLRHISLTVFCSKRKGCTISAHYGLHVSIRHCQKCPYLRRIDLEKGFLVCSKSLSDYLKITRGRKIRQNQKPKC